MIPDCKQERRVWQRRKTIVIALDEVGRGSLAGPVVACAFAIAKRIKKIPWSPVPVKDSKQLSPRQRDTLYRWLRAMPEFAFATVSASPKTIDAVNIRNANFKAMRRAVEKLEQKLSVRRAPVVFVDGNETVPDLPHRQRAFVKGDARIFSIACASVVAKVTRDARMIRVAQKYCAYGFETHKGYGTKLHQRMLRLHGLSPIHRTTFCTKFIPHTSRRASARLRSAKKSHTMKATLE